MEHSQRFFLVPIILKRTLLCMCHMHTQEQQYNNSSNDRRRRISGSYINDITHSLSNPQTTLL